MSSIISTCLVDVPIWTIVSGLEESQSVANSTTPLWILKESLTFLLGFSFRSNVVSCINWMSLDTISPSTTSLVSGPGISTEAVQPSGALMFSFPIKGASAVFASEIWDSALSRWGITIVPTFKSMSRCNSCSLKDSNWLSYSFFICAFQSLWTSVQSWAPRTSQIWDNLLVSPGSNVTMGNPMRAIWPYPKRNSSTESISQNCPTTFELNSDATQPSL